MGIIGHIILLIPDDWDRSKHIQYTGEAQSWLHDVILNYSLQCILGVHFEKLNDVFIDIMQRLQYYALHASYSNMLHKSLLNLVLLYGHLLVTSYFINWLFTFWYCTTPL